MGTNPHGIVTPEAVVLELETAGIASRGLAKMIDAVIQAVTLVALILIVSLVLRPSAGFAIVLLLVGVLAIVLGYPILCEVVSRGRSPGKAAFGLRVVTVDGAPIAARHAFIRSALGLVDFLLPPGGLFAVLVALPSPRNQRLGDLVAGTMVLRERTAAPPPQAIWFNPPPGLEGYAASLDVSRVSAGQLSVVRSFLLRVHELSHEGRVALSTRLANALSAAMRHTVPAGVTPEAFLVCVTAAHQRRHAGPTAQAGILRTSPPLPRLQGAPPPPPPPPSPRRAPTPPT